MGVYIRGMEMPTLCADCKMYVEDTYCCQLLQRELENPWADDGVELDCPLVPVPPHGRLIDADALADVFRGWIAMYDSCPFSQLSFPDKARRDELQSALAEVINAPTIITAEEGET